MKFILFEENLFLLLLHGNILKSNFTYSNEKKKKILFSTFLVLLL